MRGTGLGLSSSKWNKRGWPLFRMATNESDYCIVIAKYVFCLINILFGNLPTVQKYYMKVFCYNKEYYAKRECV